MEQAGDVRFLRLLRRVVGVRVGGAHETRRRAVVARNAAHAGAGAPRAELLGAPLDRLGDARIHAQVVAQVLGVPVESRLVGEHIDTVMMHMDAVSHDLDHNAALAIADDPVQQRDRILLVDLLGHHGHVLQGFLHLINGGEAAGDPERQLIGGHVDCAVHRSVRILGVSREVQAGNSQAFIIGAVEVHRHAFDDDADAHDRLRVSDRRIERDRHLVPARRHDDLLAI